MPVEGPGGKPPQGRIGAPLAWANLMQTIGVGLPLELRRSIRAQRRLARLRGPKV